MAKIEFPGLEEYRQQLALLGREAPQIVNRALYDGAKLLADAVQREIDTLPLDRRQIQGLHDGLGIARFWERDGRVETKIGWEGYNKWRTKRWPLGQPNALIARAQIRGTSWIHPNKFANRAAKKAREACIKAMQARLERELQKEMK